MADQSANQSATLAGPEPAPSEARRRRGTKSEQATPDVVSETRDWVADPTRAVALHGALHQEAARLIQVIAGEQFTPGAPFSREELARRVGTLETETEKLGRAAALVVHWGPAADTRLVPGLIAQLANATERSAGLVAWTSLRLYPALLVMYAAGLAAVIGEREDLLAPLLVARSARERQGWRPIVLVVQPSAVIEHAIAKQLPELDKRHTPMSDHMAKILEPWVSELQPDTISFERAFDRFEYLLGLVMYDLNRDDPGGGWAPVGRFSWRGTRADPIDQEIADEAVSSGDSWPLLKAGLFSRDPGRLAESVKAWSLHIASVRRGQW